MTRKIMLTTLGLGLAAGLALGVAPTTAEAAAAFACEDASNLCLDGSGAKWEADKRSSSKDRKKRTTKSAGTLSLTVDGGRGSLFLNGRYAGTAPLEGIEIPAGKNDIQVRDGAEVLATGLMTVPKGGSLVATVRHP